MSAMSGFVVAMLTLLFGWCAGYLWGYASGVKETERRWSDAVGRSGHR